MASLYQQPKSGYWWIKYRDLRTRQVVRASTGLRIDDPAQTRKAYELESTRSLDEKFAPAAAIGQWDAWVTDFIRADQAGRAAERYLTAWRTIRLWLTEQQLVAPRDVTYQACTTYVHWRAIPDKRQGKYQAGRNTAILEFKIFRWLMREAVKRDYCTGNPAREVVLKRAPRREFPDLTDAQLKTIYAAILKEPDDTNRTRLQRSFAVSLLMGVRLNETNVNPLTAVIFGTTPTIQFLQKGNRERIKPLHPQLFKLFRRLQAEGATQTYPMPVKDGIATRWNARWAKFWERRKFKAQIPNVCFHSLRITVENVLREAGIEQRVRESYLTHEYDKSMNARYDRVKIREMLACHAPLNRPWLKI